MAPLAPAASIARLAFVRGGAAITRACTNRARGPRDPMTAGLGFVLGMLTMALLAFMWIVLLLWTGRAMPPKPKGIGPR